MQPALLVHLRPRGPWRFGAPVSAGERSDSHFRSDRLFSALTESMNRLGHLPEWVDGTVAAQTPVVCFTSLFPFQGDARFVLPPAQLWPPPGSLVTAPNPAFLSKMRWSAATFVPVSLVESMLLGQRVLAEQWLPDPESGCLLRRDRPSTSPFRIVSRRSAAVDRSSQVSHRADRWSCVEFEQDAGLWAVLRFRDEEAGQTWRPRLEAAFRLLCDSGFGGRKRSGWGQAESPEFVAGTWPNILLPRLARSSNKSTSQQMDVDDGSAQSYWLLSLFLPGSNDQIDWQSGTYSLQVRGGYVDSPTGKAGLKKQLRMVVEGSVVVARRQPIGQAMDVAPDGFEHPVYRFGMPLSLALPEFDGDQQAAEVAESETENVAAEVPADVAKQLDSSEESNSTDSAGQDLVEAESSADSEQLTHWSDSDADQQTVDETRPADESPFVESTFVVIENSSESDDSSETRSLTNEDASGTSTSNASLNDVVIEPEDDRSDGSKEEGAHEL